MNNQYKPGQSGQNKNEEQNRTNQERKGANPSHDMPSQKQGQSKEGQNPSKTGYSSNESRSENERRSRTEETHNRNR